MKLHNFTQLAFIVFMHTNKKERKFVYLFGAGTTDAKATRAMPRTVFGGFAARLTTLFFFGAFSMGFEVAAPPAAAWVLQRWGCSSVTCSGDKVILFAACTS
jgi:hypothetical protein